MQKKNRKLLLSNIKIIYNLWKHCKCVHTNTHTHTQYNGLSLFTMIFLFLYLRFSYHDRLAMIAEAIEKEQKEALIRERDQQQVHSAQLNFDVVYFIFTTHLFIRL